LSSESIIVDERLAVTIIIVCHSGDVEEKEMNSARIESLLNVTRLQPSNHEASEASRCVTRLSSTKANFEHGVRRSRPSKAAFMHETGLRKAGDGLEGLGPTFWQRSGRRKSFRCV
jgi:hypothetical protein